MYTLFAICKRVESRFPYQDTDIRRHLRSQFRVLQTANGLSLLATLFCSCIVSNATGQLLCLMAAQAASAVISGSGGAVPVTPSSS
jgi:hypothetical protein